MAPYSVRSEMCSRYTASVFCCFALGESVLEIGDCLEEGSEPLADQMSLLALSFSAYVL